jgi:hypothetical protein
MEEANRFFRETYLPKMNRSFTRSAASNEEAHMPHLDMDLTDIMCIEQVTVRKNGMER